MREVQAVIGRASARFADGKLDDVAKNFFLKKDI